MYVLCATLFAITSIEDQKQILPPESLLAVSQFHPDSLETTRLNLPGMKWLYPEGIYKWQFHLRLQSGCSRITFVPHHILQPLLFLEEKNEGKKIEKLSFLVPYTEIKVLEIYIGQIFFDLSLLGFHPGPYQLRLSDVQIIFKYSIFFFFISS